MATLALLSQSSLSLGRPPEHRLMLACARCEPNLVLINHVLDQFEATLDWESLIQTASWHGVLPLVYRNLSELVPHRVPKAILSRLMKLYLMNSIHNQRLMSVVEELVEIFRVHSLPMMFFKGPVLAKVAYGSVNFRRFADIDILVQEKDLSAVRRLLVAHNFCPKYLKKNLTLEDYWRSRLWDDSLRNEDKQVTLDLHWQLMPHSFPVDFDLDRIWSARQPVWVDHTQLYSFSPEDLLLYLCTHGSKELWRHLIWICDVAEVVRVYPSLPWQALLDRARQIGIERMFLLGMLLAHELLEMPLPVPLKPPIHENAAVRRLAEEFKRRIFYDIATILDMSERGFWLFHNPLHLKMRSRWRDRLPQYWLTLRFMIIPNAEDEQFLKLPPLLHSLYYLIRPCRIVVKWIGSRKPMPVVKP